MACQANPILLEEQLKREKPDQRTLDDLLHLVCLQSGVGYDSLIHDSVKVLFREGAKLTQGSLVSAASHKDPSLIELLLDLGEAKEEWLTIALCGAVANGETASVRLLLERGVNPLVPDPRDPQYTPLKYLELCNKEHARGEIRDLLVK